MHCTLQASPSFQLTLTQEELAVLLDCSGTHYDGVCKSASLVGGFLYGWKNHFFSVDGEFNDAPLSEINVTATWSQIDTCLKILEMPRNHVAIRARFLSHTLKGYLGQSQFHLSKLRWEL